ncbi:hypothetical protein Tco_0164221 [Tanacetum coccineum]
MYRWIMRSRDPNHSNNEATVRCFSRRAEFCVDTYEDPLASVLTLVILLSVRDGIDIDVSYEIHEKSSSTYAVRELRIRPAESVSSGFCDLVSYGFARIRRSACGHLLSATLLNILQHLRFSVTLTERFY